MMQISDILLERSSEEIINFRKGLLKYIWGVLTKCNDLTTKHHAYLAISRFIAVFDTPSKVVLQVYRSLLRDTSDSTILREATDVLLPALKTRLSDEELGAALEYTTKVIREGGSILQMTHIWKLITCHPQDYISHKSVIMPHMPQALSSLGHQPKQSPEAMDLLVALAQLIVEWGGIASSDLDQDVVDTVLNIMIHILLVNATCKRGYLQQHIQNKITSLIASIISSQNNFKLNSFHFENMFSHGYVGVEVK
jgi:transformation/transcription domain-associated protein